MLGFEGTADRGLRIHLPTAQYLFAIKCVAMRPEGIDGSYDISDIDALADVAQIADANKALALVKAFYAAARIPSEVRFGVEEIMERVTWRRRHS